MARSEAAEDEDTLYQQIVEATGIEYDSDRFDDGEGYKRHLVDWFNDSTPDPDDDEEDEEKRKTLGDTRYDESPEQVKLWVDDATMIANSNKDAKRKKTLPEIDGLEDAIAEAEANGDDDDTEDESEQDDTEDEAEEEAPPPKRQRVRLVTSTNDDEEEEKPKRRARAARATRAPRAKREKKEKQKREADPFANRYGVVGRILWKSPKMSFPALMDRLRRDGVDYSEVTVTHAYYVFKIYYDLAVEAGVIE